MCNRAGFAGQQEILIKESCSLAHATQTDTVFYLHYHNHTNLLNQLQIPKNGPQSAYVKISAGTSLIIH